QEAADQLFAAAEAVDVGGVEECDAAIGGGPQRGVYVVFGQVAPFGAAELPAAQADLGHLHRVAAEMAVLHRESPRRNRDRGLARPSRWVIVTTTLRRQRWGAET